MAEVNKSDKQPLWHQAFLIAMVVLLAVLFIYSRGYRASNRARMPVDTVERQAFPDTLRTHEDMQEILQPPVRDIGPEQLTGRVDPATDTGLVIIGDAYAIRAGMYLHEEAYDAFREMREAALADGVRLTILSAFRTFDHQKRIWEDKWHGRRELHGNVMATDIDDPAERAREILRFSAMPGTSRHHWGTDMDLNSLRNSYFESGEGQEVYEWLSVNASLYGFCQPYTEHGDRRDGGYEEEKWHWSYIPVADEYLEAYSRLITYPQITGFAGSETAPSIRVIENYVLDINRDCLGVE